MAFLNLSGFKLEFNILEVKDKIFLKALKDIYHNVSNAPHDNFTTDEARRMSLRSTKEAFSHVNFQILGSEIYLTIVIAFLFIITWKIIQVIP